MLEGTPVVIPESSESERETQILAVANVTQISDVFDVDVRNFGPSALTYASQYHMQN